MRSLASILLAIFLDQAACAQEVIPDFYRGPGKDPNRSYVNQSFNEHIDPFNGSLQLHYVDVHVPGNGGFDLEVRRSYNTALVSETTPNAYYGSAGVGWTIHFGRVLYKNAAGPCGGSLRADVLNDPVLELPDGSTHILAVDGSGGLITTQRWRADCSQTSFTVYSPDGVRYDMTKLVGVSSSISAFYATKISDRNGNAATIAYASTSTPEVTSVAASDGRQIDFAYLPLASGESTRRISTITSRDNNSGDRVYAYGYQAIAGFQGGYNLTSVTRPGGTQWQYRYFGNRNATIPGGFLMSGLTYPEGGTISYGYGNSSSDYVYFDSVSNPQSRVPVVKSKASSDSGSWTFSYSPGAIGSYDTTTINGPGGTTTYRHVGPNYATSNSLWMVGLLMQKQFGPQNENYGWTPQAVSSQQFKRPGAWQATRYDSATNAPLLSSRTIQRDGASYSASFGAFDAYGNAQSTTESGPGGGSRTVSQSYYVNTGKWIVKQLQNQSVSGGIAINRTFDGAGNLRSISRDGVTTSYVRDGQGNVTQATFPRSLVHSYSSYYRGIPQVEVQPESVTLTRSVSGSGNVLSETDGNQHTTRFTYDGLNRLTSISPPVGNPTSISYGAASKTATRGGLTESTSYDGFGRVSSITLGGIPRTYGHDPLGRTSFVSHPQSSAGTSYQYDLLDRVTVVGNPDGTSRIVSYGAGSRTVRNERSWSTTEYFKAYGDPDQQFAMAIAAPDSSTSVTLGRNGKDLVTSISQGGFTRTYGYDGHGYLTSVVNPETGTTLYGRDDAGNMTSRSVGSSGTTSYGYDGQNRLSAVVYPGAAPGVTKTYTKTGKLSKVSTSSVSHGFAYDDNDNLISESIAIDGVGFSVGYGYSGNDQLSSVVYPQSGRAVSYSPDALGRPTSVSGFVGSISYWPSGQIAQLNYANGATSVYGQNSRLWPSSFQTFKSGSAYLNSAYVYDGAGNLSTISDTVDSGYNRALGYDAVNRLSSSSGPWGSGTLSYDGAGNLRSQALGSSSIAYAYDAANRLASVSGSLSASYSYDAYGDTVGDGSRSFGYDGVPNMICANCNDAATRVDYQYDGLNKRVSVQRAGAKTYEVYAANGNLLAEYTPGTSTRLVEYIYLGGKRIAQVETTPAAAVTPTTPVVGGGSGGGSGSTLSAVAGRAVSVSVTIGGNSPTGTVSILEGGTVLGSASVVNGAATVRLTLMTPGTHTVTVSYSGDAANAPSTATVAITVTPAPSGLPLPLLQLILED